MNNKEYLVISRSNGTTKTGSPWASLKVANLIETINVAVWDMAPTAEPNVKQPSVDRSHTLSIEKLRNRARTVSELNSASSSAV